MTAAPVETVIQSESEKRVVHADHAGGLCYFNLGSSPREGQSYRDEMNNLTVLYKMEAKGCFTFVLVEV